MNSRGIGCCLCSKGDFILTGNWGKEWGERHFIDKNSNREIYFYTVALSDNGPGLFAGDSGYVALIDNFVPVRNKPLRKFSGLSGTGTNTVKTFLLNGKMAKSARIPSQCVVSRGNKLTHRKCLSLYR